MEEAAPGVPREFPRGIWRRWIERYELDKMARSERNGEVERVTLPFSSPERWLKTSHVSKSETTYLSLLLSG